MLKKLGFVGVPQSFLDHAETIKHENYKTNTPKAFQKHSPESHDNDLFLQAVSLVVGVHHKLLDLVYFSVSKGAEPHTDMLDPEVFTDWTYVIPIILPEGDNYIYAEEQSVIAKLFEVYEFNHTKTHGMTVANEDDGCVLIMIAVKKQ